MIYIRSIKHFNFLHNKNTALYKLPYTHISSASRTNTFSKCHKFVCLIYKISQNTISFCN